jgi:ABC-type amino acid transport system permease subunit
VAVAYLLLIYPVVWLTGVLERRLARRVSARA